MRRVVNLGRAYVNTYLVEIKEGWVLVDTGYPFDYRHFLRKARRRGIELSSIRYVVLTHVHADHAGFLKKILADTGATLVCLPTERARLASGVNVKEVYVPCGWRCFVSRISASLPRFQTFEPVDTSDAVDPDTQPLAEEGITFFVLHGHTDNDLCFRLDDKIFVGDICMNGAGATGCSPLWIEDNTALVESWRKLLETDAAYYYVGHGKPISRERLERCVEKQANRKLRELY